MSVVNARYSGGSAPGYEPYFAMGGQKFNRFLNSEWSKVSGDLPSGYSGSRGCVVTAIRSGSLSSFNGDAITFSATSDLKKVMTLAGTTTFSLTTTSDLGLIVSLAGNGTFTFTAVSSLSAISGLSGSGTWSLTGNSSLSLLVPLAGTATFSLSATSDLKGIANLEGHITPYTELSPESLAAAVWNAVLSEYQEVGSTGKALNDAGAAGNPWSAVASANQDAGTMGEVVNKKLLTTGKFLGLK